MITHFESIEHLHVVVSEGGWKRVGIALQIKKQKRGDQEKRDDDEDDEDRKEN